MTSYKGRFEFQVVNTSFSTPVEWASDAIFGIMVRHNTTNLFADRVAGPTPSWDKIFTIDFHSGQTIKIGLNGIYGADEAFSLGTVVYNPQSDIDTHSTAQFTTQLTLPSNTVELSVGSTTFETILTLQATFTPQDNDIEQPSAPVVAAYPTLATESTPFAPPATPSSQFSPQPYNEPSFHLSTPAPTYPVNAEGIEWSIPTGQSDKMDVSDNVINTAILSQTPQYKKIDLHYPLSPSLYIGQKRMFMRTLPDGKTHSNPEKGSEGDPAQLSMVEFSINPSLTINQITEFSNDHGDANLWKPADRYRGDEYDDVWFKANPHAWGGSCDYISFYFSEPTPTVPSLLVGIDQVWENVDTKYSNSFDNDGTLHMSYGYTPHSVKSQYQDTFPFNPSIQSHTFKVPLNDYISALDITSGKNGITSVRIITANGVDSGLMFHRGTRSLAQDVMLYKDLKQADSRSFQHEMIKLYHTSSSQHSALAYFCVYERPVLDPAVKAILNHDQGNAQCDLTIGGLRICSTHPIKTAELTTKSWTKDQPTHGPTPTATAVIEPLSPMEMEDVNDYQNNTAVTTNLPTNTTLTTATYVNTAANYSSASTPYSASSGARSGVKSNNAMEFSGWGFVLVSNILFLGAIAIIMTLWTKEINIRTDGPTTCQAYGSKANMLWIIVVATYLYVGFFFAFILAWIICVSTGCTTVGDSVPLKIYNVACFIYAIFSATFASVAMAWVFKIPIGCITMSERWILFTMYLLILCAFPGFIIALIVTSNNHYLWYHAIWLHILINIFSVSGFAGLMVPICNSGRDGCCCCESDHV